MTNTHTMSAAFDRDEIAGYLNMPETGDYAIDLATGRRFADSLIVRMSETGFTPALGTIVREMMALGRWTALHAGFFQRLADRCLPVPA